MQFIWKQDTERLCDDNEEGAVKEVNCVFQKPCYWTFPPEEAPLEARSVLWASGWGLY